MKSKSETTPFTVRPQGSGEDRDRKEALRAKRSPGLEGDDGQGKSGDRNAITWEGT